MSYPFLSALTDLESRVQAVEAQLERLDAALPFDEHSLLALIQDANLHATALADLVRAERPQAEWDDRPELDSLLQQLELDAEASRREQRCDRLLELAAELQAGQVKHRFEARTAQLNELRLRAVAGLRERAAVPVQAKDLPGPGIGEWLDWAFNLKDDEDAAVIAQLREDFVALEEFTGEMEGIYWQPAKAVVADTAPPAEAGFAVAISPPENGRLQPGKTEDRVASATQESAHAEPEHTATQPFTPETRPRTHTAPNAQSARDAVEANAATGSAGLSQPSIAPPVAGPPQFREATEDQLPPDTAGSAPTVLAESGDSTTAETAKEAVPRKRLIIAFGSFVALSALFFAIIYHLHARNASRPAATVQAADIGAAPASPTADSDVGSDPSSTARPAGTSADATPAGSKPNLPMLHKQPAEGPQDSIALSLEQCGRGAPDHVECWGYVSNLGGANSRVSLDRIDVVDGRGNSFSLDRNGQFAFPNGRSSNVAPGNKVKFTVKVPDNDADARTLTLYMDLSNPRNLEYTFRDVPIAR